MSQPRVFFIGASTVEGMGDTTRQGWPGRLMALEGSALSEAVAYNLGVRGQTTVEISRRWRAEVAARMPAPAPVLIVFSAGINDTARLSGGLQRVSLRKSLVVIRDMMEEAQSLGSILWVGPFPIDEGRMPYRADSGLEMDFTNARIEELNREMATLSDSMGIPYVDLFTPLAGRADWLVHFEGGDGLHPSADGYQELASMVQAHAGWQSAAAALGRAAAT